MRDYGRLPLATLAPLSLILTLVLAPACRCGSNSQDTGGTAGLWSATEPFQVDDGSLADDEYVALGLAGYDHNWGSSGIADAAVQLRALVQKNPTQLPRYGSARSGKVFARLTSNDNLNALRNAALPLSIRLPALAEYLQGLNDVIRLYVDESKQRHVSGNEVAELYGTRLKAYRSTMELVDAFMQHLGTADPSHQERVAAIEKMRHELAATLGEVIGSLSEPRRFGLAARRRLVDHCSETFPVLVSRLPVVSREELLRQLNDANASPHLANLQPQLNRLKGEVGRVLEHPLAQ